MVSAWTEGSVGVKASRVVRLAVRAVVRVGMPIVLRVEGGDFWWV